VPAAKRRKRKCTKESTVIEFSSSDSEEESVEKAPKLPTVKEQIVVDTAAVQPEAEDKVAKLFALAQENERLKISEAKKNVVIVPTVEVPEVSQPVKVPKIPSPKSSLSIVPCSDSLTETCKNLYMDNIGLRTEVDIYEHEAREHYRARKRAEGNLAQAAAAAFFVAPQVRAMSFCDMSCLHYLILLVEVYSSL